MFHSSYSGFILLGLTVLMSYGSAVPARAHPEVPKVRIVGGREASPHSAPFMVYFQPTYANNTGGTCAGALLSKNYFLTAAHCLDGKIGWAALFGGHDVTDLTDPLSAIRINGTWKLHPNYSPITYANDIAIVNIPSGVPLNSHIQPVKLPSRKDASKSYVGVTVSAYGWGNTAPNVLSKVLMTVNEKVVPITDCAAAFPNPITNKHLCSFGGLGKGTCVGDSGAPIMYGGVQIGIVSFGDATCGSRIPEVNTKVDQYLDWIEANTDVVIQ